MKQEIAQSHYKKAPWWMFLLLPLSYGYNLGIQCRLAAYKMGFIKTVKVSVPVISIGNLSTGGTGKTPVIMALAQEFLALNKKVVILSRGYGASEPIEGGYGEPSSAAQGDEAWLIKKTLPQAIVIVGSNRSQNALRAIKDYQPDVILLDDGYQHIKLERDINILLVDGYQMMGNGFTLPVGPMREPFSEIKRADAIWITKTRREKNYAQVEAWREQYGKTPKPSLGVILFEAIGFRNVQNGRLVPLESLKGQDVLAFSGIAKPSLFQQDLANAGVNITNHLIFQDHHNYSASDLKKILSESRASGQPVPIISTEKDRVKIEALLENVNVNAKDYSMYTLVVRPVITAEALPESLKALLSLDKTHAKTSK